MPTITATELARNTRQILDQVAQRRETVVVERNQTVIARIVPAEPVMNAAQALEGLPQTLGAKDAARSLRDSRTGFEDSRTCFEDSRTGFEDGVRDPWA